MKPLRIGWQEWVSLPNLNIPALKAKIDTGAKTSSLHAFDIRRCKRKSVDCVKFIVEPIQGNHLVQVPCCAPIIDIRNVMSSNGHMEKRFVISDTLEVGDRSWTIEITLSNRDPLRYRMLLGREALRRQTIIEPAKKLMVGKISSEEILRLYR